MPIVFIHGVATRRGARYDQAVRARDALFRRYVYERLHLPAGLPVTNAYWGDDAAEFRWGNASVPTEGIEAFGVETPFEDVALAEFVDAELEAEDRALTSVANVDPELAFDLLWSVAAIGADETRIGQLAEVAHRASSIFPNLRLPISWLPTTTGYSNGLRRSCCQGAGVARTTRPSVRTR